MTAARSTPANRPTRTRRVRPSIRLRLTLTYSVLFVTAGAAMLAVNYVLVSRREHKNGTAVSIVCRTGPFPANTVPVTIPLKVPPLSGTIPPGCTRVNVNAGYGTVRGGIAFGQLPPPTSVQATQRVAQFAQLVMRGQNHTLHSLEVESAITLGLMAVASVGLGWLIAGRALQPVHRITDTARRLSEETLDERIDLEGPDDELKELADTFDAMLGRLDRAFASQRRFVANASHELRTPLATDRVLIDEALANRRASPDDLRSILTDLRTNNEQMAQLIDGLLLLARSERGLDHRVLTDLAIAAEQVLEQAEPEAVTRGIDLRSNLNTAEVVGDPTLLTRLIGNLVENGIRHNLPAGGWVELETTSDAGQVRLRVVNSGRVLDPRQVPALFEPFRRETTDRTVTDGGFGLGLSIVQSVVEAHGGRILATARDEGGLDITVVFRGGLDPAVGALPHEGASAGRQYSADRGAMAR